MGRPRGARNKASVIAETLIGDDIEAMTLAAIEKAKTGDVPALRLCFQRVAPPMRGRPILLDLPAEPTIADVAASMSRTIAALAAGELTTTEADEIMRVLEAHRRTVEVVEVERRVRRLEQLVGLRECD